MLIRQKTKLVCCVAALAFAATSPRIASVQGPCGGKPCPRIIVTTNRTPTAATAPRGGGKTSRRGRGSGSGSLGRDRAPNKPAEPRVEVAPCDDAELVVVCHMPGCEIVLNDQEQHVTDNLGGFTFQVPGNQPYRVRVAKAGYDTMQQKVRKLECGDQEQVNAQLVAKPVTLRVRTVPGECNIFLDRQQQSVRSDSAGRFSFLLSKPTLLIEAKKSGYLSATQTIVLAPEWANREVVLELEPISARVKVLVNVEDAQITIDDQVKRSANDQLLLRPGQHVLSVEALGYTPTKFDLTVGPDQSINKEIRLERLPVTGLQAQAEVLLGKRAYDDVRKLCKYIFEADKENGPANRLDGYVFLAQGDFANAVERFARALSGGERIALHIRRHLGEKFELAKGHDACEAQLIFYKSEIEFQGIRNPSENFKVPYEQLQVGTLQLKSSVAVYLATKVTVNTKRRDYNFYNFDKELSQSGKPYLEMIQRLMRSH